MSDLKQLLRERFERELGAPRSRFRHGWLSYRLRPFTFDEAAIFFGREREVDADRPAARSRSAFSPWSAVRHQQVSLIRAGLWPASEWCPREQPIGP